MNRSTISGLLGLGLVALVACAIGCSNQVVEDPPADSQTVTPPPAGTDANPAQPTPERPSTP